MKAQRKRIIGIIVFTLLYPIGAHTAEHIPNPMVPGAIVALNMIFPVLAGYFYGPISGALVGGFGTAISALWRVSMFDAVSIGPHIVMGLTAGWVGKYRSDVLCSLVVVLGHALNLMFYARMGLMTTLTDQPGLVVLGVAAEATVDIVALVLAMTLLKRWLYEANRW